jgi:hypothetical protein
LFTVALMVRLWGINFGLPALYRPDEDVTVGRAMGVVHGVFNPVFADWPHLYFYLAAAWLLPWHLIGVVSDQASGYLGVRILDALIGSATVVLVFEFGRRAYGLLAGGLAAAALAFAFLHVRDSHFATVDVPVTLATAGGLYVAFRTLTARGVRPLLINGIMLGVAAGVKYNGALIFSGIAAAQWLRARLQEDGPFELVARLVTVALIGFATLVLTSPFLVLDPRVTVHGIGYIFLHLGEATAPAIGWVELGRALWYGIDPALLLLSIVGVVYALWRRAPADWILLAYVAVYFLLIGAGGSVFFRYADPLMPPLLLLAGRVLSSLVMATAAGRARWLALSAATVIALVPSLIHDLRYDTLIQQTDTRTLAFDWLAQHVPEGGRTAIPYMTGPAHDQGMIDSRVHSHSASDPYVAGFLDGRLETQYHVLELSLPDLQLSSLARFRELGIEYVVIGYETPGTGCHVESPLERTLAAQGPPVASFSPTVGCSVSVFDPIDTYYVPLAGYAGWLRPGPPLRIYRIAG